MEDSDWFEPGHEDRVVVVHANFDGTRFLTGSLDHRIKVWNVNPKTRERSLLDTFTAHDAWIIDAKFTDPSIGSYIGTIGGDLCFKLWEEDKTQAPNSGRRFKNVLTIPSTPRVVFTSLDFKTVDQVYIYLALIDKQGLLSVYEPADPDNLTEWNLLDQFHVYAPVPNRGDETSFRLCFDKNATPLAYMNSLSDDSKQLGLLVSGMNEVKIYHSVADTGDADSAPARAIENGASHRLSFHEAFRFPTHSEMIRSIDWAPCNTRGTERIASGCRDGTIRIFELAANPASSLTSAITGRATSNTSTAKTPRRAKSNLFPWTYQLEHSTAVSAHGECWSVHWDRQGNTLLTGGNDGITRLWKKSIEDGECNRCGRRQQADDKEGDEIPPPGAHDADLLGDLGAVRGLRERHVLQHGHEPGLGRPTIQRYKEAAKSNEDEGGACSAIAGVALVDEQGEFDGSVNHENGHEDVQGRGWER
ncbi:hypothetical protein DV738_g5448, partial [Chaetothyriales sp. CBS 135597]